MLRSRAVKRTISIVAILAGVSLIFLSVQTNVWWRQATPVSSPRLIQNSVVYAWRGLYVACFHLPSNPKTTCKTLKEWGLDDESTTSVRHLMYAAISIAFIEILVVSITFVATKKLFMDFITLFSTLAATMATVGLSVYTKKNPTHLNMFVLYGYSYLCGWLGVCCCMTSSLMALMSRLDDDRTTFLHSPNIRTVKTNL